MQVEGFLKYSLQLHICCIFPSAQLLLESKLQETTELSDKVTMLDEKLAGAQEDCKGYNSISL